MRLPSKPYSSLPIYSIGSTKTLPRERISAMFAVGQGLSLDEEPGPSAARGAAPSPPTKAAPAGASKGAGNAARSDKPSSSPQRHGVHKTMSK